MGQYWAVIGQVSPGHSLNNIECREVSQRVGSNSRQSQKIFYNWSK